MCVFIIFNRKEIKTILLFSCFIFDIFAVNEYRIKINNFVLGLQVGFFFNK